MLERFTWEQVQEKHQNQWVGLIDVKHIDNDGSSIESTVVKYSNLSRTEIARRMLRGEVVPRYTTPDDCCQLGCLGV